MRLVHVCLRYPPASGGVENYIRDLVEGTRQLSTPANSVVNPARFDVRVLTSRLRTHHPATALSPDLLLDDPPYVQRLHHLNTPWLAYPRLQALPWYLHHHHPDIIHGYSFWYQPADVAARFAARRRLPFIFHPMFYLNSVRRKPVWQLYQRTIGAKTMALADAVIVISPFEQQLIKQAGFTVKQFHLIPPGIDLSRFDRQRLNPYLKLGLTGQILLSVSRLAPGKGLIGLIKSFPAIKRQFSAVKLILVGEDFGLKATIINLIKQLGLVNDIHLVGYLSADDLVAYYQHADVLVHPSHYEAFGIVLAESLAAGTPVIARDVGAVSYVAPPQVGALLFSSLHQMVEHVTALLTNSSLAANLSRRGQKYIQTNFPASLPIKKMADLYQIINHK